MFKSLISINDLSTEEIRKIMELAAKVKANPQQVRDALEGHIFGFIFEKPSTRTWVSFQAGIYSMGGGVIYLGPARKCVMWRASCRVIFQAWSCGLFRTGPPPNSRIILKNL
jgi:ornithine carbamoyltransferase